MTLGKDSSKDELSSRILFLNSKNTSFVIFVLCNAKINYLEYYFITEFFIYQRALRPSYFTYVDCTKKNEQTFKRNIFIFFNKNGYKI